MSGGTFSFHMEDSPKPEGVSEPNAIERLHTIDLVGCARCRGEGHARLTFRPLTHPVECENGERTHWAPCPTNGEPILMRILRARLLAETGGS